ncbi:MAG: pentapeptide repeat-containing protein [Patescibacteria group bacterium]
MASGSRRSFNGCSFMGVDMSKVLLRGCTFINCKFQLVSLMDMDIKDTHFTNCLFNDVKFDDSRLTKANYFDQCTFETISLTRVSVKPSLDLSDCQISDIDGFKYMRNFILSQHQLITLSQELAASYGIKIKN